MVQEIAVIAGSSIAGAISAAFLERLSRARVRRTQQQKPASAARSELASLLFEKGLACEAITRVYEAAQEGKIDRIERDRLLMKYKQQLDSLNQRIASLQPVAEFADLAEMRSNLVSLIENKIASLDKKLLELSKSGVSLVHDSEIRTISVASENGNAQTAEQEKPKHEEKSIEQLQKEIMQALYRLEQVEIDKE